MLPQQYCLRWKHHHTNVQSMFSQLLEKERFCDVTLYCSPSFGSTIGRNGDDALRGVSLRAHRVVLAACSELLGALLGAHDADARGPASEPVLVVDGARPDHVRALLDYMYTGEMNVHHSQLASLLKTAEELRIKGLSDIRWTGKDEPPDCKSGAVTATAAPLHRAPPAPPPPVTHLAPIAPSAPAAPAAPLTPESPKTDRQSINGGPPPLIKLTKAAPEMRTSPTIKREQSTDTSDSPTMKRQRMVSKSEQTDEEEKDFEWQNCNADMKERLAALWAGAGRRAEREPDTSRDSWPSDEEWTDAPADMAAFLHTRLQVDGDNDEEGHAEAAAAAAPCEVKHEVRPEVTLKPLSQLMPANHNVAKANPAGAPGRPADPRFADVVKLNEYLLHGRRPHFWEEDYVRRVMEAVRMKELEMKQAAEILGVSYGTLYGRYRDVYGCINRPYRMKDFWMEQGPAEVLTRLQRGECTLTAAAEALAVTPHHLAAYLAGLPPQAALAEDEDFEPIPIEGDPMPERKKSLPSAAAAAAAVCPSKSARKNVAIAAAEKAVKKILIGSLSSDTEDGPAAPRETRSAAQPAAVARSNSANSSRDGATSPSSLMRSRPDLTIVASSARHDS